MKVRRGESPGLLAHKSRDTVVGARAGRRARCMGHGKAREGTGKGSVDGTRPSTGMRGRGRGEEETERAGESMREKRRESQGLSTLGADAGRGPMGSREVSGVPLHTCGRVDGQLTSTVVRVTASAAATGGRAARAASHHIYICRVP